MRQEEIAQRHALGIVVARHSFGLQEHVSIRAGRDENERTLSTTSVDLGQFMVHGDAMQFTEDRGPQQRNCGVLAESSIDRVTIT